MSLFFIPSASGFGQNFTPIPGSKLFFFDQGTSTPRNTYTTSAKNVAHTNPVVSDGSGVFPPIYVSGAYTARLEDSNGRIIDTFDFDELATAASISGFVRTTTTTTALIADSTAVPGLIYITEGFASVTDNGSAHYRIIANDAGSVDGISRILLNNGNIAVRLPVQTFEFDTIADAKAAAWIAIGDRVDILGGTALGDGKGSFYRGVAGSTGTADDVEFIDLTNGNQLQIVSNREFFQCYAEKKIINAAATGAINLDLSMASTFELTLTGNTTITFINAIPSLVSTQSSTVKVTQDGSGNHTLSFAANIKWPGDVIPVNTKTSERSDIFVFMSFDNYTNVAGQTGGLSYGI